MFYDVLWGLFVGGTTLWGFLVTKSTSILGDKIHQYSQLTNGDSEMNGDPWPWMCQVRSRLPLKRVGGPSYDTTPVAQDLVFWTELVL